MSDVNIAGVSSNISSSVDESILNKRNDPCEHSLLLNRKIGISISDSAGLLKLGYSLIHMKDATIEMTKYLLIHGATLVYGGDLRKEGFTSLFAELSKLYSTKETRDRYRFINYFAWPIHLQLTKSDELDFRQNKVKIERLPLPDGTLTDTSKAIAPDTNENKTVWAKSLSYMRETMNANCNARVFVGGRLQNFSGRYPGIIEEAYLALQNDVPCYFTGAYGGATKEIILLLSGQESDILTEACQTSDPGYKSFYEHWNEQETEKIDYTSLSRFFRDYSLARLCRNNGLTEEENKRLFVTNNLSEMIFIVLKGLKNAAFT